MRSVFAFFPKLAIYTCLGMLAGQAFGAERLPLEQIEGQIKQISTQLQKNCPLAAPDDQAAFNTCRRFLFTDELTKGQMAQPVILWGRQKDAQKPLKDTNLTQFAPDILAGLYLPLFMFSGQYTITFHEKEKLYLVRLGAAFRNRLQPGQFPYPFWHEANKWNIYENARAVLFWIAPNTGKIRAAQFSAEGEPVGPATQAATTPAFDGKWVWTDAQGQTQPTVTLFDGLYRDNNPFKPTLDKTYREFAVALRESQCLSCHVPSNPDGMKRLVLLQSPAHASGEIQRLLKSVRDRKMPLDDLGMEKELDPQLMKVLLDKGGEFEKAVLAAREWERVQTSTVK